MSRRVTIDDMDMRARLRSHVHVVRQTSYVRRETPQVSHKLFQDIEQAEKFDLAAHFIQAQTAKKSAAIVPRPSGTEATAPRLFTVPARKKPEWRTKLESLLVVRSRALTGLAIAVLVIGGVISLSGFLNNRKAQVAVAQASIATATNATTTGSGTSAPSTAPVTSDTLQSYQVAPDMARYIRVPKLNVWARVLQVGVTKTNALATPSNVFDAAWYKASAKPGQPGATLIDGHVSSWTTNGVFFGIKNLVTGDNIEIEKGDGTKLEYTVVQTTAYDVNSVDMKALQRPVMAGKSGLNLITCGGKYDSKAGEFTQRIAVFATLNN